MKLPGTKTGMLTRGTPVIIPGPFYYIYLTAADSQNTQKS